MEKRLTADLNVVANSNLEIQLLDGDLNIIQKLDDEPNDVGGLTSAELKAKFDESGNIIKKYINETLIPAVLAEGTTAVRYTPQTLTDAQKAQARANINAAPGGFGLGGGAKFLTASDDLNTIWQAGWYAWDTAPKNAPTVSGNPIAYCSALVLNKGSDYNRHQIVYTLEGYELHRSIAETVGEWEWVNPPMVSGVEYRTTEQRNGKAVYKKLDTDGLLKWRLDGDNTWQIDDGQQVMEIDLSDSITMGENCLWTTVLNLSTDSAAAMKIKQAALAGNAKVTVKIKVSSSAEPERVTLRMVGSQYTDAELGERYNLIGTAVLLGIAPIDVMLGAYGGDPPTHVLGGLVPQLESRPLEEFDLADDITLSDKDLFNSNVSIGIDGGGNKSVGEKIKQAALARIANVTVTFKFGDKAPERVTLPMFGTQETRDNGTTAYALTGTYALLSAIPVNIMICADISENTANIWKRLESLPSKPLYDPVDKPDATPDGAFLRWSGEQKKWVAETVPAAEGGTF